MSYPNISIARARVRATVVPYAVDHPFRLLFLAFFLVAAFLIPVSSASADPVPTGTSSLSGVLFVDEPIIDYVRDYSSEGWGLSYIKVLLTNTDTSATYETVTNEFGYYEFMDLVAGTYTIQETFTYVDPVTKAESASPVLPEEYNPIFATVGQFSTGGGPPAPGVGTGAAYYPDAGMNDLPNISGIVLPDNVSGTNYNFPHFQPIAWAYQHMANPPGLPTPPPGAGYSLDPNPSGPDPIIPEPGSLLMLLSGSLALATLLKRRRG